MRSPVRIYSQPGDIVAPAPSDHIVEVRRVTSINGDLWLEIVRQAPEAPFAWPEIPGVIYNGDRAVAELHRCHRIDEMSFMAISLGSTAAAVEGAYAGDAVLHGVDGWASVDLGLIEGFDHEHDTFDFTKIMPSTVHFVWHHSANGWWAVDENFQRFVREDVLGWRADAMQARPLNS